MVGTNTLQSIITPVFNEGIHTENVLFNIKSAKLLKKGYKIFEASVSYKSRSVEEGKKISWGDGLAAAWALIKYRFLN